MNIEDFWLYFQKAPNTQVLERDSDSIVVYNPDEDFVFSLSVLNDHSYDLSIEHYDYLTYQQINHERLEYFKANTLEENQRTFRRKKRELENLISAPVQQKRNN